MSIVVLGTGSLVGLASLWDSAGGRKFCRTACLYPCYPLLPLSPTLLLGFLFCFFLIWSVGILSVPVSVMGAITSLLASQMLDPSSPSSQSIQCSAFALHIASEYLLCCCQYSLCIRCWLFWQWYFDLPLSCCIFFLSSASSGFHHLLSMGMVWLA
jgi:hypothetical protein